MSALSVFKKTIRQSPKEFSGVCGALAAALFGFALAPSAMSQSVYTTPYAISILVDVSAGRTDPDGLAVGSPSGVVVDAAGNLYIANPQFNSIRKVAPDGVPSPFAGTAFATGSADGPGASALFNNPNGIAIDKNGNLYVADTGNFTVRKITPDGTVTTLAGTPGVRGVSDGTGAAAQFDAPYGVAVDSIGNVYVSEEPNDIIRKITPSGVVTTLAGLAGAKGSADGTGSAARFDNPEFMAIDADQNVILADSTNDEIRKITPSGVVTTLAGAPEVVGSVDGAGAAARFYIPTGVAIDGAGDIFVADTGNGIIRRIAPDGSVSTVAGTAGDHSQPGANAGVGPKASFNQPTGVALDGAGNLYIDDAGNDNVEKGVVSTIPVISSEPVSQFVLAGSSVTLSVTATGSAPVSYQWSFDGVPIPGATTGSYSLQDVQASDAGAYSVTASSSMGSVTSNAAKLEVGGGTHSARLINISTRASVGTGADILIPGFVIGGSGTETLLVRAVGPTLASFGVTTPLAQPTLAVFDSSGNQVAGNTGWQTGSNPSQVAAAAAQVHAFSLPAGSADCALLVSLPPGAYTAKVAGASGATGVALAEIYEVSATGTRLINISTRAAVGTGENILIPGFVISGTGTEQLLVRADGPSLGQFNVADALARPALGIFDASSSVIASNVGWSSSPDAALTASLTAAVNAYALVPGQADSALSINLAPGTYTMEVSSSDGTTGVALAEVYEAP